MGFAERKRGSFVGAVVAGLIVAMICAAIWGGISVATGYQIGWLAIGVGFAVGIAVQVVGKGETAAYGIIGGGLSLFALVLGNFFSVAGYLSRHSVEALGQQISVPQALHALVMNPEAAAELMKATFSPMDLLFYGLALYMGFKCSYSDPNKTEG